MIRTIVPYPEFVPRSVSKCADISAWMSETPVISNEDQAREAKLFVDRGKLAIADCEDERAGKVKPLNEQVKKINDYYRGPRELLERVVDELTSRVTTFLLGEEKKRIAAAEEAARIAQQAEQAARDAENKEREAFAEADAGTLGLDIAAVTAEADKTFADYLKKERQAALAERETKVKIGGGFRRALSLRDKETPVVTDPIAAYKEIGLTNDIILEAIIKASKAYKKVFGKYPTGVGVYTEREA